MFDEIDVKTRTLLIDAIAINTDYSSQCIASTKQNEPMTHVGNKTECALLGFVLSLCQNYEKIRQEHPEDSFKKVFTFNSSRKSMSTVIPIGQNNNEGYRVFTKGASEIVLQKCEWNLGPNGKLQQFSDADRNKIIKEVVEQMASNGLRTICLAYKDYKTGWLI